MKWCICTAGLAVNTRFEAVSELDSSDKFNKTNTVTSVDLKNSKFIVQINTELMGSQTKTNALQTLRHELGHVFGLKHDDTDTLMTTYPDAKSYTGEISSNDKTLATAHILKSLFY